MSRCQNIPESARYRLIHSHRCKSQCREMRNYPISARCNCIDALLVSNGSNEMIRGPQRDIERLQKILRRNWKVFDNHEYLHAGIFGLSEAIEAS